MNKIIKIILFFSIISIFIAYLVASKLKSTYAVTFTYPEALVENIASVTASENGCGRRETFVYQMILAADMLNGHYYWNHHNDVTLSSLCYSLKHGWRNDGYYCNYTFNDLYANRSGRCTEEQEEQLKLAARMALSGSFTIPKNVYGAAEKSVMDALGTEWVSYRPESWTGVAYFFYPNTESLATVDRYEDPVRQDFAFYQQLADCLYNNPTLYGAHNNCSATQTKYTVYLYPNGGSGISNPETITYTGRKSLTELPTVTKTGCTFKGWYRDSVDGTKYNTDVGPEDNGKSFYAGWNCPSSSSKPSSKSSSKPSSSSSKPSSSSSKSSSKSQSGVNYYTVTFMLNDGTNDLYWSEVIKINKSAETPKDPTRKGYEFAGWTTKNGTKFDFNTKITNDIILYAKWIKNNGNSSQTIISSRSTTYTKPSSASSQSENPQTGIFGITLIVLLMIPTSLGIFIYYKNYISDSTS